MPASTRGVVGEQAPSDFALKTRVMEIDWMHHAPPVTTMNWLPGKNSWWCRHRAVWFWSTGPGGRGRSGRGGCRRCSEGVDLGEFALLALDRPRVMNELAGDVDLDRFVHHRRGATVEVEVAEVDGLRNGLPAARLVVVSVAVPLLTGLTARMVDPSSNSTNPPSGVAPAAEPWL